MRKEGFDEGKGLAEEKINSEEDHVWNKRRFQKLVEKGEIQDQRQVSLI